MSHTAGVAVRECKRPGMTSSPHSPRVYRLSRPGAVSARSVGTAAVSPGGDIIICPPPTGVLRSNSSACSSIECTMETVDKKSKERCFQEAWCAQKR